MISCTLRPNLRSGLRNRLRDSCMVSVDAPCARDPLDQIAVGRAHDAPQIDPPVPLKILVFNRNDRVAQNLGIVLVPGDDPPLQGKGADHIAFLVIEFGDGAGAVALQIVHLRKIRRNTNSSPASAPNKAAAIIARANITR